MVEKLPIFSLNLMALNVMFLVHILQFYHACFKVPEWVMGNWSNQTLPEWYQDNLGGSFFRNMEFFLQINILVWFSLFFLNRG